MKNYKALTVESKTHKKIVDYCNKNGLIIKFFASKILEEKMNQLEKTTKRK